MINAETGIDFRESEVFGENLAMQQLIVAHPDLGIVRGLGVAAGAAGVGLGVAGGAAVVGEVGHGGRSVFGRNGNESVSQEGRSTRGSVPHCHYRVTCQIGCIILPCCMSNWLHNKLKIHWATTRRTIERTNGRTL